MYEEGEGEENVTTYQILGSLEILAIKNCMKVVNNKTEATFSGHNCISI